MRKRSIFSAPEDPLKIIEDERGTIVDIFYKQPIEHVAMVETRAGAVRGNHYHRHTVQHVMLLSGSLEYWYKSLDSTESARAEVLNPFDLVTTPKNEIHAIRALTDCRFIVLSEGLRGGKDFELDTFRISESLVPIA